MRRRQFAAPKDEALAEARDLARLLVPEVLAELARLACNATSESVRVTAIKEILDRAHGRPSGASGEGGTLCYVLVDDGYAD